MVHNVLIDTLNFKSKVLASRWKELIRKAPQLRHYNSLSDETLIRIDSHIYPQLARTLDRGLDRSIVGDFFVRIGKDGQKRNFPISEMVYAIKLDQQMLLEYIESEFILDNPVTMYQTLSLVPHVADFFLLGVFYLNKGYNEQTYLTMNLQENVSEELLRKCFKDDFFFKKDA
ncbi:MAG: hypothetical protein LBG74_01250 [Spirochaetaceae bacterium]|jgi:hypothetical protein|nr:hypothetical protein [Spirochaetaceae bacterium]